VKRSFIEAMKKLPKFRNEDEEREFWATHSPLDYFDISSAKRGSFPKLRPTLRSISLRLPEGMIDALKILANKQDIPYQSLVKILLARGIQEERSVRSPKKDAA